MGWGRVELECQKYKWIRYRLTCLVTRHLAVALARFYCSRRCITGCTPASFAILHSERTMEPRHMEVEIPVLLLVATAWTAESAAGPAGPTTTKLKGVEYCCTCT